ncbi:MAG: inorganic phosphate transporter [Bacteroidaceae bacterium]|nr:inorganic phosphate transporter [Bacteroidaceae bacterium]
METFYLLVIAFLLCLAIFDMFVGVSNDAVNFLSSAVGSKAARFKTVLIIAAVGILVGTATSSGMMDIARHGILQPQNFTYAEVMCVFLAVVCTDVMILDIFNSLGLPTSTTVSMVFELFGGATAMAVIKMMNDGGMYSYADYINTEKVLSVIMAIFVSVAIAFVVGLVVMWLSRIVFTFHYERHKKWTIGIFGGISITSISYFLITKGFGQASFMTPDVKAWISLHSGHILISFLVFFTILTQVLSWMKVNIFKIVVLFGTFSLAMAFAGNDLVNFIGVSLAGLSSTQDYMANGQGQYDTFMMTSLCESARMPIYYLVGAGVVMIISLFISKKARKVINTSISLSKQNEGDEIFSSSRIARRLVRMVGGSTEVALNLVPIGIKRWVNSRFAPREDGATSDLAFDLVRASVNLVLAGLLIVIGTTLKLPLSTTYVAFMVGMGSSLADRAWGRESAVYRITGVISVIGGWFITAGAAFLTCFLITNLMHFGGPIVMAACVVIILVILVKNNLKHKKADENSETDELFSKISESQSEEEVRTLLHRHIRLTHGSILEYTQNCFFQITDGLLNENIRELRKASNSINDEKSTWLKARQKEIVGMRKINIDEAVQKNTWFHLAANSLTQIFYCLKRISDPCLEHVDNYFNPLPDEYKKQYLPIRDEVVEMFAKAYEIVHEEEYNQIDALLTEGNSLKSRLSEMRSEEQNNFSREGTNIRLHFLYLNTLQETQELVSSLRHLLRATKRFYEG